MSFLLFVCMAWSGFVARGSDDQMHAPLLSENSLERFARKKECLQITLQDRLAQEGCLWVVYCSRFGKISTVTYYVDGLKYRAGHVLDGAVLKTVQPLCDLFAYEFLRGMIVKKKHTPPFISSAKFQVSHATAGSYDAHEFTSLYLQEFFFKYCSKLAGSSRECFDLCGECLSPQTLRAMFSICGVLRWRQVDTGRFLQSALKRVRMRPKVFVVVGGEGILRGKPQISLSYPGDVHHRSLFFYKMCGAWEDFERVYPDHLSGEYDCINDDRDA